MGCPAMLAKVKPLISLAFPPRWLFYLTIFRRPSQSSLARPPGRPYVPSRLFYQLGAASAFGYRVRQSRPTVPPASRLLAQLLLASRNAPSPCRASGIFHGLP